MMGPLFFISVAFSALYFIMVFYFFVGWLRTKKAVPTEIPDSQLPFVTVIIPVRNESEHIKACLESVFAQKYPAHLMEVIVIDDYSTDPTVRLARELNKKNLLVFDLQQYLGNPGEYFPNKKKAIAMGVKNAQGDLIITTDGDCTAGQNWLRTMVSYYQQNNFKMLTGPVLMRPARNPLAWFQQLDVINMVGIGGATMRNGAPTMCNGANLMYSKAVFQQVQGFKGNHEVPTGDDIFLMHKINAQFAGGVGFVKNFDACVFTKPEKGFGNFVAQRVRWVSKSSGFSRYNVTLTLLFAYLFNLFIIISGIFAFAPGQMPWLPVAIAGGTKLFIDLVFDLPLLWFFKKMVLLLLFPFIEVFHIIYVVVIGPLSLSGRYRWKDRLVK